MLIKNSVAGWQGKTVISDRDLRAKAAIYSADRIVKYRGFEIGLTGDDAAKEFAMYISPDDVFSADALASFGNAPICIEHPKEKITAKTASEIRKGHTTPIVGREAVAGGEYVVAELIIDDDDAINLIKAGTHGLSVGVNQNVDMTPGVTADGRSFDGKFTDTRCDHLAITADPRLPETQIIINSKGGLQMPGTDDKIKAADLAAKEAKVTELEASVAALTADLEAKNAKIAELEAKVATPDAAMVVNSDAFKAAVSARVGLLSAATGLVDGDLNAMGDADIAKKGLEAVGVEFAENATTESLVAGFMAAAQVHSKAKPAVVTQEPAGGKPVHI